MASDADPHYTEVIKQYEICTGCGVTALFAGIGRPMLHPVLDVLLCQECSSRFRNEEFELNDKGRETVCRWCAKGEQACMFGDCSSCPYVFCLSCIARNMNTEEIASAMKAITERDKNDWQCFRCRREALKPLVEKQREFMRRHSALKLNPASVAASRLLAGRTPGTPDLSNGSVDDSSCDSKNVSFNNKSTDIVETESSDSNLVALPESTGFDVDSDSSISRRKRSLGRRRKFMGSNSESEDVSECPTSGPEMDVSQTDGASPLVWRRPSIDVETADEMVVDSASASASGPSSFAVEKIRIESAVHVSPPNSEDYRDASIEIDIGPTGDSQEREAARPANIFLESQANTPTPSDVPTKSKSPSPRVKTEPLQRSPTHESTASPSMKVKTEPLEPSVTGPSTTSPSLKVETEPLQPPGTPELTASPSPKVKNEPLETSSPRQSNAEKSRSRAVVLSPPLAIEPDAYFEIPDSSDDDLRPIDEIFIKSTESESASVKVKDEVTDRTGGTSTSTTTTTSSTEKKRPHSDDSTGVNETPRKPKKRMKKSPRADRSDSSTGTSDVNSILGRIERIKRKKKKKTKGTEVDRDSEGEEMPMDVPGEDTTEKKRKQNLRAKVSATEDDDLSNLFLDSATRSEYSEFTDEEISATAKIMFKPPGERFCPDNLPSLLRDSESDFSDWSEDSDSSEETDEKKPKKEKKRKKRVKKTASEEEAMSAESGPEESERRTYSRDSCSETDSDSDSDSSSSDERISVNPDKNGQGVNKNGSNESTPIDMDDDFTPESQADFNKSQEKLPGTPGSQDDELPNLEPKKEKKKKRKKKLKIWSDEEGKKDGYSEAIKRKHKTQKKKKYESKVDKSWDRFTVRWRKRKGPRPIPKNVGGTPEKKAPQRRDVRPVINDSALRLATKRAQREEKHRRARLDERRGKQTSPGLGEEDAHAVTRELILERDLSTGKPKVEVDKGLIEKLKPHQVEAVQFMWDCCIESVEHHEKTGGSGSLLAHCMGLGKTLSTIVFIHTVLRYPRLLGIRTVLVISPLNAVLNWEYEWEKWFKYQGAKKPRVFEMSQHKTPPLRAACIKDWKRHGGVLVIGYELFRNLVVGEKIKNPVLKQTFSEGLAQPGADLVVCDEGHVLRNSATNLSNAVQLVETKRRIVLTGTPLQNNLREYYTMVNFVKPSLLGTKKEFSNQFINPIINGQCSDSTLEDVANMKARSHVLHDMLAGVILRKDYSVLKPYLKPKYEYVLSIRISDRQKDMYLDYLGFIFTDRGWEADKVQNKGGKLFVDFHNFSKICTHPWVFKIQEQRESRNQSLDDVDDKKLRTEANNGWKWWSRYVNEADALDLALSGKLVILLEILHKAQRNDDRVLVFSQSLLTLDLIEKFLHNANKNADRTCGKPPWAHGVSYFRLDGSTNAARRQTYCERFNDETNRDAQLFLISTKAGSLGINLYRANRVIVFDACWNPSYDIQAMFRAYRLGQKKTVYVYRFLAQMASRSIMFNTCINSHPQWECRSPAGRVALPWRKGHDMCEQRTSHHSQKNRMGTMEEKIYDRQVTKQSLSHRVVDEHQIERHYTQNELAELYQYQEPEMARQKRGIPPVPKDDILAEILQEQSYWLITFHEHDSLLKNQEDEQLSVAERQAAWEAYEAEKSRGLMALPTSDVPAHLIQEVMNQVEMLNMDPSFIREVLDILYTKDPDMSITAMVTRVLIYFQDPDLFDRLKRPYVNTLDHRDYINGAGPSGVNYGAGLSGVNYGAGPSGVNYGAGPSDVNYGVGPSIVKNGAGPSGVNYGAGPSGVNYGAGPSIVNYGAGPSGVNYGVGPSIVKNSAGPSNVKNGAGPSGVKNGAGPSNVKNGAGPSNVKNGAGPSGVKNGAGPSIVKNSAGPSGYNYGVGPSIVKNGAGPSGVKNGAGPSGVNYGAGPSNVKNGAGPSNVKHGAGPSGLNQTSGQPRVTSAVTNSSSPIPSAPLPVDKRPAAPIVSGTSATPRVSPTLPSNAPTTSKTQQSDFAASQTTRALASTEAPTPVSTPVLLMNANAPSTGLMTATAAPLASSSTSKPGTAQQLKPVMAQQLKPGTAQQPKPGTTQKRKPVMAQQLKPGTAQQLKPVMAQQLDPVMAQQLKPGTAQQLKPSMAQQLKPGTVQQLKPSTAQQLKPGTAQQLKPVMAQQLKPGTAQKRKPGTAKQLKPAGTTQQLKPGTAQQLKPGTTQQLKPGTAQQLKPCTTQQLKPGTTQQLKPGTSQQLKPGTAQQLISERLLSEVIGPERMKQFEQQKRLHLSPNSTNKLRNMVAGGLGNTVRSPLVAPSANVTTTDGTTTVYRPPGNGAARTPTGNRSTNGKGSTSPTANSAATQQQSGRDKQDAIVISPKQVESDSPDSSKQDPSRYPTSNQSTGTFQGSSQEPIDLSPTKRITPARYSPALQNASTPRRSKSIATSSSTAVTSSNAAGSPVQAIPSPLGTTPSGRSARGTRRASRSTRGRGRGLGLGSASVESVSANIAQEVSPFRNRRRISSSPYYRPVTSRLPSNALPPGGGSMSPTPSPLLQASGSRMTSAGATNASSSPIAGSTVPRSSTSTRHSTVVGSFEAPNPSAWPAAVSPHASDRIAVTGVPTSQPPPAHQQQPRSFSSEKLAAAVSKANTKSNATPAGPVRPKVGLHALTGLRRKPNP